MEVGQDPTGGCSAIGKKKDESKGKVAPVLN
jgi:hypothetical protein